MTKNQLLAIGSLLLGPLLLACAVAVFLQTPPPIFPALVGGLAFAAAYVANVTNNKVPKVVVWIAVILGVLVPLGIMLVQGRQSPTTKRGAQSPPSAVPALEKRHDAASRPPKEVAQEVTSQVKKAVLFGPTGPNPGVLGSQWLEAPTSTAQLPEGVFAYQVDATNRAVCTFVCTAYSEGGAIDWVNPNYSYNLKRTSGLNGGERYVSYHKGTFRTLEHTDSLVYLISEPKMGATVPSEPFKVKITARDADDGKARIRTWTTATVVDYHGQPAIRQPLVWGQLPPATFAGKKITWRCTVETCSVAPYALSSEVLERNRMEVHCDGKPIVKAVAPYYSTCLFTSEDVQETTSPLTIYYTPHGGDQYIWVSLEIECKS